jgi:hypothetical protein
VDVSTTDPSSLTGLFVSTMNPLSRIVDVSVVSTNGPLRCAYPGVSTVAVTMQQSRQPILKPVSTI